MELPKYYWKLLCDYSYMTLCDHYGSNWGVLDVQLISHELGFS